MEKIKDYGVVEIRFDASVDLTTNEMELAVKGSMDNEIGKYLNKEQTKEVEKATEHLAELLREPIRKLAKNKIKQSLVDKEIKEMKSLLPDDVREGLDKLEEMMKKDDDSFVNAFKDFIKSL